MKTQETMSAVKRNLAVSALIAVVMAAGTSLADLYWVGGANGLWSGDNWASSAGGAGAAWADGATVWFTTSPVTIDVSGESPSLVRFKTSGFSADNPCKINLVGTGDEPSVLTYSGFNRENDDDLHFAELSLENIAVKDTSSWGFELTNGSHIRVGDRSTYVKPARNNSGDLFVGLFSATSNSLTVASGATVDINNNAWIGCTRNDSMSGAIGVVHVDGGTLNIPGAVYMGRSTSSTAGIKNNGHGVLVVENGGIVNVTGNLNIGCTWKASQTYSQRAEIRVGEGGQLLIGGGLYALEYGTKTIVIDGGLLKATSTFEPEYASTGKYKGNYYSVTVKNGGILAVKGNVYVNSTSGCKETVTFDGGTFRAEGSLTTHASSAGNGDYTDFLVDAGGMTIDTQSYTLTWQTRIDESEGKVTKKGSGKLNLNWTTYNAGGFDVDEGTLSFGGTSTQILYGDLTVKSGATLEKQTGNNPTYLAQKVTFKDGANLNVPYSGGAIGAVTAPAIVVEGQLAVSFSATPAPGAYPLLTITGEGTFDESVLSLLKLPEEEAYAGAILALSADEKSVMFILSSDPVWIGGTSGDLGDATKWSNGVVPGPTTNAIITAGAAATLTNSAAFRPKSITFPAGCPKVTIEGAPISNIEAINNLSAANHDFKVAVSGDALVISNTTTYCVFSGGLTAGSVVFGEAGNTKCSIYGTWHITGDWTPVSGNALYGGASVTVDGALLNPNNLSINSGCVVTAATLRATGSCGYFTYINSGRLVVTGLCSVATTVDPYFTRSGAGDNATVEFGSFYADTPGKWTYANAKNIIVGAGGIDQATPICFDNAPILRSRTAGFALNSTGGGSYVVKKAGLTIDTTQYETELPATVTINGTIINYNANNSGKMTVTGCGTVLFNSASMFQDGLTVNDTATVAVNADMKPGNGAVTLQGASTLKVAQSGTVELGGNLAIADGAALAFNFTDSKITPTLALASGMSVTPSGKIGVKVSKDRQSLVISTSGELLKRKLTSGFGLSSETQLELVDAPRWVQDVVVVDGDIVLSFKYQGTILVIR